MAQYDLPDAVGRQVAALADSGVGRRAAKALQQRHAVIDLHRQPGRETLMIAKGEVIVRAKDARKVARLLGPSYTAEPLDMGQFELVRFSADKKATHIVDAVRRLRTYRIDASPNTVVTCGMRSKALASPRPTSEPLVVTADPTAGKNAHVVVIDTGIYTMADQRTDKILKDIKIDRKNRTNVDPLFDINVREGHGPLLDLAAGHGTFVTGIVRQVAPKAKVTVIRALNSDGVGTTIDIANAIIAAAGLQPDIINMSFATEDPDNANPIAIVDAVAAARLMSPHTVFVAAAGNSPDDVRTWPATLPGVVAVGGLAPGNLPSSWSKRGSWIDVSMLGEGVVSTYVEGTEDGDTDSDGVIDTWTGTDPVAVWTGTSFAAPRLAGAIAARICDGTTAKQALDALITSGTPMHDWGIVVTA